MSNQMTCMVADGFSHYKLRGRFGRWFWRVFAIRQIFNEGYLAGWKAALIVEGQKPSTNSGSNAICPKSAVLEVSGAKVCIEDGEPCTGIIGACGDGK